jgi:nitrite reductase/ring-hydroxylating ferredoxin subunit
LIIPFLMVTWGCGKDKIERNPYFTTVNFNINLNLNLPAYNDLRYTGGALRIRQGGINGLLLFNLNGNDFLSWEASCPNHPLRDCSTLSVNGVLAECSCEGFQYSLATGQLLNPDENTDQPFPMLFYNVRRSGNTLIISN